MITCNVDSVSTALNAIGHEIEECDDVSVMYKLYRQARVWNRYQYVYAKQIDLETYHTINERLKFFRNQAKYKAKCHSHLNKEA